MIIQIQYANEYPAVNSKKLSDHIDATVKRATSHFRERISRVNVQLKQEDTISDSDKHCTLKAQLEGLPSILASYHSERFDHAVDGAAATLKATLSKSLGHRKQH